MCTLYCARVRAHGVCGEGCAATGPTSTQIFGCTCEGYISVFWRSDKTPTLLWWATSRSWEPGALHLDCSCGRVFHRKGDLTRHE